MYGERGATFATIAETDVSEGEKVFYRFGALGAPKPFWCPARFLRFSMLLFSPFSVFSIGVNGNVSKSIPSPTITSLIESSVKLLAELSQREIWTFVR